MEVRNDRAWAARLDISRCLCRCSAPAPVQLTLLPTAFRTIDDHPFKNPGLLTVGRLVNDDTSGFCVSACTVGGAGDLRAGDLFGLALGGLMGMRGRYGEHGGDDLRGGL